MRYIVKIGGETIEVASQEDLDQFEKDLTIGFKHATVGNQWINVGDRRVHAPSVINVVTFATEGPVDVVR
ncbi:hypothetical protein [Rothia halotolerans]|uniref:hypothetical protein n=1 Tax=Rothia halotolerans TaxID=405770 RepID=UPI00101D9A58|nr:hypothetical protein [Rothia halotolerans]